MLSRIGKAVVWLMNATTQSFFREKLSAWSLSDLEMSVTSGEFAGSSACLRVIPCFKVP